MANSLNPCVGRVAMALKEFGELLKVQHGGENPKS
jgi:hypothetical protein